MAYVQQPANQLKFKKILALVRGHDYAHPGETEAIDLVFSKLSKKADQLLLDVGCGLGGTAQYIAARRWGKVIGCDIDGATIKYAKEHYSQCEFYECDVLKISSIINRKVDIIYAFNSFYAFADQLAALQELRKVAHENTVLAIFDYAVDSALEGKLLLGKYGTVRGYIDLKYLAGQLEHAGWELKQIRNLDNEYDRWYDAFIHKVIAKKAEIIAAADEDTYDFAYNGYQEILDNIRKGILHGVVVYAEARIQSARDG
jgi:phosphoethanolamine N-methyltransferase